MWLDINEDGFEEIARRFGCTSREQIEKDAHRGIYHETGSITGIDKDKEGNHGNREAYHEDPSIVQ